VHFVEKLVRDSKKRRAIVQGCVLFVRDVDLDVHILAFFFFLSGVIEIHPSCSADGDARSNGRSAFFCTPSNCKKRGEKVLR
jgi:hypothetical protein